MAISHPVASIWTNSLSELHLIAPSVPNYTKSSCHALYVNSVNVTVAKKKTKPNLQHSLIILVTFSKCRLIVFFVSVRKTCLQPFVARLQRGISRWSWMQNNFISTLVLDPSTTCCIDYEYFYKAIWRYDCSTGEHLSRCNI